MSPCFAPGSACRDAETVCSAGLGYTVAAQGDMLLPGACFLKGCDGFYMDGEKLILKLESPHLKKPGVDFRTFWKRTYEIVYLKAKLCSYKAVGTIS